MTNATEGVKNFYDKFSESYTGYANGTSTLTELLKLKESDVNRAFSWGDVQTWQSIEETLALTIERRQQSGDVTPITLLDVGCGDGVWALRVAHYCFSRGQSACIACLDLSPAMLESARKQFDDFHSQCGANDIAVTYEICDLSAGLPAHIRSKGFDITLCLHTVLNHLPANALTFAISELVISTHGYLYFSVKPPFSKPTFYAAPMSEILHFDRRDEHLYALDRSGGFHVLRSNLISHQQLKDALLPFSVETEYVGLDVLISRLTPDPRWVGDDPTAKLLPIDDLLSLEARASLDSRYLNFANHILAIVDTRPRPQSPSID